MMLTPRLFQAAVLGLIVSCGAVVAPEASAQHRDQRGEPQHNQRQVVIERNTRGGSVRVQVRTGHDDHRNDRYDQRDQRHNDRGVREYRNPGHQHQPACPPPQPQPTGYWKTVYHPPVYRTVYDCYGRPRCVMVQRGYTQRVWVAYDHHGHDQGHIH